MKLSKVIACVLISICASANLVAQIPPEISARAPFSIGEVVSFQSNVLDEERSLNIYLPLSYNQENDSVYPVIYLLDGSADEDFIHIAGLVQFGSFSWINMIPETIVVGISNVDRQRDFTFPSSIETERHEVPTSGGSARFINFLENEVLPLVESTFRVDSTITIIGQSLGGLLATEILFKKPKLFDNYIIVSPSLWWDNESLLQVTPNPDSSPSAIYIAVGKEGDVMERVAKELADKVRATISPTTQFYWEYFEQLDHGDALHLAVYDAFEKMFRQR